LYIFTVFRLLKNQDYKMFICCEIWFAWKCRIKMQRLEDTQSSHCLLIGNVMQNLW